MRTTALIFLAALCALPAGAEVKFPGTVLSSECSKEIRVIGTVNRAQNLPHEICFASVVGQRASFLTIDEAVWQITKKSAQSVLELELAGSIDRRGVLQYKSNAAAINTNAIRNEQGLSIKIKSQVIRAENFQILFHTE